MDSETRTGSVGTHDFVQDAVELPRSCRIGRFPAPKKEESELRVKVENVTSSIKLGQNLDLDSMSSSDGLERTDAGERMLIHRPTSSVSVQFYENGSVVCTGSRSTAESVRLLTEALDRFGVPHPETAEIRDIMASSVIERELNLEKTYPLFGSNAEYDPEWFTGLIVHFDDLGTKCVVYGNGKLVVSGAKDMDAVYDTLERVRSVIIGAPADDSRTMASLHRPSVAVRYAL